MQLKSFFIVGAPKCGTTSLYYYLKQHPQICLPEKKELHYFSSDSLKKNINGPGDRYVLDECIATEVEYNSHYKKGRKDSVLGDISPSYLYFEDVPYKIRDYNQDAKIIIILREHSAKAFSQYCHLLNVGREHLSFENALKSEKNRISKGYSDFWYYAESTKYYDKVKLYIDIFGEGNVLILLTEDLQDTPGLVLKNICEHIGVSNEFNFSANKHFNRSGVAKSKLLAKFIAPNYFTKLLRKVIPTSIGAPIRRLIKDLNTGRKPVFTPDTKLFLKAYFKEDRINLEKLLKRHLPWD